MKKNLILYILGVLIFILSIVGLTYAFMKPKVEEKQKSTNISINSCAKVQLKDNGKVINLENTYPMADEKGLETNPYEFIVSSTCEDYIGFNLYLTSLSDNQIADNIIHFAITSKSKEVLSEGILASQERGETDFNSKELKELNTGIKGTAKNIYKVYSNNIPFQGESTYQLYLWVDKDASNETMGQSFKVGLSVKSYNRKETLAEYLIKNKNNTLIYHDGLPDYEGMENANLEAGDLSYRYSGGDFKLKDEYVDKYNYTYIGIDNELIFKQCDGQDVAINYLCNSNNLAYYVSYDKENSYTTLGEVEQKALTDGYIENNINNYVCFDNSENGSCENSNLYRIIGLFKNDLNLYETKLIKYNYSLIDQSGQTENFYGLASIGFNKAQSAMYRENSNYLKNIGLYYMNTSLGINNNQNTNRWNDSNFNKNVLNKIFLNSLGNFANKIVYHNWIIGGNTYDNMVNNPSMKNVYISEIVNPQYNEKYLAKIGLMYVNDFGYAAASSKWNIQLRTSGSIIAYNWMYMGLNEWTISSLTDVDRTNQAFRIFRNYNVDADFVYDRGFSFRPTFYLEDSIQLINGNGSKENPFRLKF